MVFLCYMISILSCISKGKNESVIIYTFNGVGSTYQEIGNQLEIYSDDFFVCDTSTNGSIDNIRKVDDTRNSFGLCQSDVYNDYVNDCEVEVVDTLYKERLYLLYRKNRDGRELKIKDSLNTNAIEIFGNKNAINIGRQGSGTRYTTRKLINAINNIPIKQDTLKIDKNYVYRKYFQYIDGDSLGDEEAYVGISKLVYKKINYAAFMADNPDNRIRSIHKGLGEIARDLSFSLVEIDTNFIKKHLGSYEIEKAKVTVPTPSKEVSTIGSLTLLITHKDTPQKYRDEMVNTLNRIRKIKKVQEKIPIFKGIHKDYEDVKKDSTKTTPRQTCIILLPLLLLISLILLQQMNKKRYELVSAKGELNKKNKSIGELEAEKENLNKEVNELKSEKENLNTIRLVSDDDKYFVDFNRVYSNEVNLTEKEAVILKKIIQREWFSSTDISKVNKDEPMQQSDFVNNMKRIIEKMVAVGYEDFLLETKTDKKTNKKSYRLHPDIKIPKNDEI